MPVTKLEKMEMLASLYASLVAGWNEKRHTFHQV